MSLKYTLESQTANYACFFFSFLFFFFSFFFLPTTERLDYNGREFQNTITQLTLLHTDIGPVTLHN